MARQVARTVAVIGLGPSAEVRQQVGPRPSAAGYTVYPVHPTAQTVEGLPTYKSVKDVPVEKLDRVSIYLPPAIGMTVLADVRPSRRGKSGSTPAPMRPKCWPRRSDWA